MKIWKVEKKKKRRKEEITDETRVPQIKPQRTPFKKTSNNIITKHHHKTSSQKPTKQKQKPNKQKINAPRR